MKHRIRNGIKEYGNMVFHDGFSLIRKCGSSVLLFEILYKMFFIAIFYPVLILGFDFTLEKAGFRYLTNNYLWKYLLSPYTIIFILLMLLILAFYTTYEVACLSICFDAGQHGVPIPIMRIFSTGAKLMRHALKKKKINTVFHITVISLMMNITLFGFFLSNIKIPDAASEYIRDNAKYLIPVAVLVIIVFIYALMHIFTMNYVAYDGDDISDCKQKSRLLIKRRKLKTVSVMIGWNVLILLAIYVLYFILALIICLGVKILDLANFGMAIYLSIFRVVLTVVKILMVLVGLPLSYAVITGLFYRYRNDTGNQLYIGEMTEEVNNKPSKHPKAQAVIAVILSAALIALNISYMVRAFDNNPFDNVEYLHDTQTMAHRGYSYAAPENTLEAVMAAVDATSDYVEIDVHETKDGVVVVMHDDSLRRTTGVSKKIYSVTYDEIKDLDAGSWFSEEFSSCRIPTLEEIMEYADGKIKLNIEIKLSKNEPELVEKVAMLIKEYDFYDDCYVTSMNYEALTEIKKYDERIKTGYVLQVAYGNFYNISDIDAFSINYAYVTKNLVDTIHHKGKEIFAWTVNSKSTAERMTAMGVDAIITDNPVMARETVYSKYSNKLLENVLSYVFNN